MQTEHGTFTGLGEAHHTGDERSTGRGSPVALAKTRAKARALRDAVGAVATPIDDLDLVPDV